VAEVLSEPVPQEPFTILLLGSDIRPEEEAARADTIIVARIDPEEKGIWLISIPRDTRVRIPGYGTSKINAANFHGGPSLMIETVQDFLGIPINHYMEMDFDGFEAIVDALGGIWIDVPTEIDDWKASSHSPGHRAQHIDAGYQLLDGEHALTFVRSRDFPEADFARMRNQQEFFRALAKQSTRWENILKIPTVVREFAEYTVTDMGVRELVSLGQAMRGVTDEDVRAATLVGEWRSPYVVTDEAEKERIVEIFMAGGDFDPTEAEGDQLPSDVSVTVRNGAGIGGVAQEAADILTVAGYDVVEIGNANQFVYDRTLVVYDEEESAAHTLLEALGQGEAAPSRGMYSFSSDVLVVVGKDWGQEDGETEQALP
jgi:LCP family protein required for cell wall assembly